MGFEKTATGLIVYKPLNYDASKRYPLIVFLHGIGERGDGAAGLDILLNFLRNTWNNIEKALQTVYTVGGVKYEFIMVAPQLPQTAGSWQNSYVDKALTYAGIEFFIDWTKVYLTGVSLGGGGVWGYASSSLANAQKFAAIAPVCGVYGLVNAANLAKANVGVWAFHAKNDTVVGVGNTTGQVSSVNSLTPVLPAKQTLYDTGDHYIWGRVYDPTGTPGIEKESVNLFEWFLMCSQGKPVAVPKTASDTVPVSSELKANAGPDQITQQGTPIVLDGSASTGNISWASWELLNPGEVKDYNVFQNWDKSGLKKTLQNTYPGVYKFQLKVNGPGGAFAVDTVTVTVQAADAPVKTVFVVVDLPGGGKLTVYADKTYRIE